MKWKPNNPVTSHLQPRVHVSDYKKDIKFDFFDNNLLFFVFPINSSLLV